MTEGQRPAIGKGRQAAEGGISGTFGILAAEVLSYAMPDIPPTLTASLAALIAAAGPYIMSRRRDKQA